MPFAENDELERRVQMLADVVRRMLEGEPVAALVEAGRRALAEAEGKQP